MGIVRNSRQTKTRPAVKQSSEYTEDKQPRYERWFWVGVGCGDSPAG